MTESVRNPQRFAHQNADPLLNGGAIGHGGVMHDLEGLRRLAADQHGLVSRSQAHSQGVDRWAVRRMIASGRLTALTPRVLRIGGSATSQWQSVMAGVLDVGYDAVASHLTAAALWGVPSIRAEPVHLSVSRVLRRRQPAAATIHHLTRIPDDQRLLLHDIPVTAPPLTTLLVCGTEGAHRAAQVFDHFLAAGLATVAETWKLVDTLSRQGRNGLCDLRKLLDDREDGATPPQSNNERRFEYIARTGGITTLRRQVDIRTPTWIGRVDYCDCEVPLIVEIHSERYHTSWAQRRADAARVDQLETAGYTVVIVWDHEIWHSPDSVLERVRKARARLLIRRATS
ncbi:hypothetical protein BH23ACT5_BH23ACT5_17120 [soil metagenome]